MRRTAGFVLIVLSSMYLGACGASKTPAEPPVALEDYLNEGWQAYRTFDFIGAKAAFKKVMDANSNSIEAYFGYMLSNISLGDYNQATSYSSIALFLVDPSWTRVKTGLLELNQSIIDTICSTIVTSVDTDTVDVIIDSTVTPPETTYVLGYRLYGRYALKIADGNMINWGRVRVYGNKASLTVFAADGEYIVGNFLGADWDYPEADTLRCALLHPWDTLEYAYDYTISSQIDSLGLSVMITSAAANMYAEEYVQTMKIANAAFLKDVASDAMPQRIPVRMGLEDLKYVLLRNYFNMGNYYLLTLTINRYFDPAFPYSGWSLSNLDDVNYVDEHIDEIKAKYYELLTGVSALFKIKSDTKRR